MKGRFLIYSLLVILIDSGYMKDKSYSYKILLFSLYIKVRNNSDKKTLWKVLKNTWKIQKSFWRRKRQKVEKTGYRYKNLSEKEEKKIISIIVNLIGNFLRNKSKSKLSIWKVII